MSTKLSVLLVCAAVLGVAHGFLAQQADHVWTVAELFTRNVGSQEQQRKQFPPHRIIGNLYYVGTETLSAFVVDTPAGDILIDTTYEANVPVIQDSMAKLGLKFSNIKIVVGSHAHGDHQEADAMVVELTGAKAMALAEDIPDLQRMRTPSGKTRPSYQTLQDGDEVKLGGMTLVAHLTPGHTHGCTTWTMKVQDNGETHNVVIIGSMGVNTGTRLFANGALTAVGEEYVRGFKAMHALSGDVPLGSHPAMHGMAEKYKKLGSAPGSPNPYIDAKGYLTELNIEEGAFNVELEGQKGRGESVSTAQAAAFPATSVNRWLIPIGAVAVHICIGSVYAWSTLNRPILNLFPNEPWWFSPPYTTFSTALVLLGLSAAFGGPWVERHGPRVAATAAALFFGIGLLLGALGLQLHQSILVFFGMGVIGGIGCGLGYIAPVSTLVKWFPDRRGMATGMAIMGFGGGAYLAAKWNAILVTEIGVARTVAMFGVIYLVVMLFGARILQRPPAGWKPQGWAPPPSADAMIANRSMSRNAALGTVQFYLLWGILFVNVTAGIGILAQASPIMQDLFQKSSVEAGAMVSIISLFNAGGRFFWASSSDYFGRRNTYAVFFVVQFALFLLIPGVAAAGSWSVFLAFVFTVFTMYGGGFATIPAFLADIFGPDNVGAIHGAVLTAWSAAAITGPLIITQLSNRAKAALPAGASRVHIYDAPLQVLASLLAVGFVLTLLVRPIQRATHHES